MKPAGNSYNFGFHFPCSDGIILISVSFQWWLAIALSNVTTCQPDGNVLTHVISIRITELQWLKLLSSFVWPALPGQFLFRNIYFITHRLNEFRLFIFAKECIIVPIFIESGLQQLAQPWFWKLFNFVRNNSEGGNKMGQNFALFLNWMDGTLFCFPPWAWEFSKIFTIWVNEQTEMNKTSELCFSWMQRIHSQTYELIYLNSSMISNT